MESSTDFMYDNASDNYNKKYSDPECGSTCNSSLLIIIICVVIFIYTAPCLLIWVGRFFSYFNKSIEETTDNSDRNIEIINLDYNRDYNRNNSNRGHPLPKYQASSQLSDNDIYFTLPPIYSEEINISESENATIDSEVIDIISDSENATIESEVIDIISDSENEI
jgi:hypothetical protein